ncbi:hypothetical protein PPTG_22739 [Phytophthora nicotianae INRA-310]|uniref:Uncharacterized protein n=1 Tax=Phytophthora nicotianae (strain INRA-310) TaxID=761204 RepID=W2QC42_PHYN3|nr:hypothetical protein PPTG_22739 [Phytophthora nicotianae INRA-310]ETN10426.1 hypothetical protein PPTG_22739 [Phytophthora nicotianae INRA-310]
MVSGTQEQVDPSSSDEEDAGSSASRRRRGGGLFATRSGDTAVSLLSRSQHSVRSEHGRFEAEMEAASMAATGTLLPWVRQRCPIVMRGFCDSSVETYCFPSSRWRRQEGDNVYSS